MSLSMGLSTYACRRRSARLTLVRFLPVGVRAFSSSLELSADGPQTAELVIQLIQTVNADVFMLHLDHCAV